MRFVIVDKIQYVFADAIVNSVGVGRGVREYGGICNSIVRKINSKDFSDKIDNARDIYVLGDYFVTKVDGQPFKNVINLITPYFAEDKDLLILTDCVRRILYECTRRKFKRIAIPLIGAGANGYNHEDVCEMLEEMISAFMKAFSNGGYCDYDVCIVVPPKDMHKIGVEYYKDELYSRRQNIQQDVKKGSKKYLYARQPKKVIKDTYAYFQYGPKEKDHPDVLSTSLKKQPGTIKEYADLYTAKRYEKEDEYLEKIAKERLRAFVGYGKTDPKTSGSKTLSDMTKDSKFETLLKVIFGLKMNLNEARSFLEYFQNSFPSEKVYPKVNIVYELINQQIYDFYEIKEKLDIFE